MDIQIINVELTHTATAKSRVKLMKDQRATSTKAPLKMEI
jgi:hypothetical protein